MIVDLKSKGIKVGIITDGRPDGQRNKLDALGLDVDDVIITDELGGVQFRKPCDIAFRIMTTRWRLNPADVVYVGDNPAKDFQAAQQLGMRSLWYRNVDGLYSNDKSALITMINALDDLWRYL
jgi:HAD superfamily hydrolase (TIGR01549 family)